MNIVSFHKRDLQLVIQYLSVARITGLSEELRFFSANPTHGGAYRLEIIRPPRKDLSTAYIFLVLKNRRILSIGNWF